MPDAVPLIDLDRPPPPAPAMRLGGLARPARTGPVLAMIAAALLTLGGAAPPRGALVQILSIGGTAAAAFRLGPGALYTAAFGTGQTESSELRRYDLRTGREKWVVTVPQNVQVLSLDDPAGLLLARSGASTRLTVLDAADGRELWHLDAASTSAVRLAGGRLLLRTELTPERTELRLADGRTGAKIWSRFVAGRSDVHFEDLPPGGVPRRFTVLGMDGHVTTLRWADGVVLGEGSLGVPLSAEAEPAADADFASASVVGDRVYVSRSRQGRGSLTAFRLLDLTILWRTREVPVGYVSDCGPVVCVSGRTGVLAAGVTDGSVRWSARRWLGAYALPGGRTVAYDQAENRATVEVEPLTGRVLRDLGQTVWLDGAELRTDEVVPGVTWVRLPTGAVTGSVQASAAYACEAEPPYLACPTISGATGVWRLPLT